MLIAGCTEATSDIEKDVLRGLVSLLGGRTASRDSCRHPLRGLLSAVLCVLAFLFRPDAGAGGNSSICARASVRVLSAASAPSQVAVRLVADFTEYPHDFLPGTIQRAAEIVFLAKDGRWVRNRREWDKLVSQACGEEILPTSAC